MGNTGIKILLALLIAVVGLSGYLVVESLDRVRATNVRLLDRLEQMERNLRALPPKPEASVPAQKPAESSAGSSIANREFFDPAAETGGRLILAISAEPPSLNPITCNEATATDIYGRCQSALAEPDLSAPEELRPMLAEKWEISPDHLQYRIFLRKGVKWQDFTDPVTGKVFRDREVTAKDFAFHVQVIQDPAVNCAPLRSYYQDLKSVEVLNDYEFTVTWSKPFFGSKSATLGLTPLPRHFHCAEDGSFDGRKFNDDHRRNRIIVGCGPYRFRSWESDKRIVLERNDTFFGNALGVGASIQTVVYEVIKHPNTRFQSLLAGELDLLTLTPEQWFNRTDVPLFTSGKLKKYRYLLPSYNYIGYNQKNPLFQDKRVRRALTMLIDRERIRRDIYKGLAEPAVCPFFPLSRYVPKDLKPLPYDVPEAKRLLAEAGWRDTNGDGILEKDGKPFTFTMLQIASHPIQERMMPMLKEFFAAAGVDMRLQIVEWSVCIERLNRRNYDACSLGWSSSFDPDPYQVWHSSQCGENGSNHISYRNRELDALIEELRRTFDPDLRVQLTRRIARLIHEEQPYTFLFFSYSLAAVSGRYRNVRVFPGGIETLLFWTPRSEQLAVPGL